MTVNIIEQIQTQYISEMQQKYINKCAESTLKIQSDDQLKYLNFANLFPIFRLEVHSCVNISFQFSAPNITCLVVRMSKVTQLSGLNQMQQLVELQLYANNISDLSPLRLLTNLVKLDLAYNKITNINPLKALANLQYLILSGNKIQCIFCLKYLTNLMHLDISQNQIINISPLSQLQNIKFLFMQQNQIISISPLNNLQKLTNVSLQFNFITDFGQISLHLEQNAQIIAAYNGVLMQQRKVHKQYAYYFEPQNEPNYLQNVISKRLELIYNANTVERNKNTELKIDLVKDRIRQFKQKVLKISELMQKCQIEMYERINRIVGQEQASQ
ncbi:leucine_Rich Repeat (LRR)-containing protein [Hexamita inflata]|uniref:Partial n=1 Tax=Hexamita inflata TaxID=28002 RepID=A0AA86TPR7_9EUKA|nr:leucine Rich Repeat (LRR)-containing protein [Hexamita inflata]